MEEEVNSQRFWGISLKNEAARKTCLYFDISKREPLFIKGYNQTQIGVNDVSSVEPHSWSGFLFEVSSLLSSQDP